MKRKWLITLLPAALLLAGGGLLLWKSGFFEALSSQQAMRDYIQRFSPYSHLFFFLLQVPLCDPGPHPQQRHRPGRGHAVRHLGLLPAHLGRGGTGVRGGLSAGPGPGQPFVDRMVSHSVAQRYLDVVRRKQDVFLILAFLFPFFPDDLICILAGLTDIPFRRFLIVALLTRPWGLLAASALGGSTLSIPLRS